MSLLRRHRWSLLILAAIIALVLLTGPEPGHTDGNWTRDRGMEYMCGGKVAQVGNLASGAYDDNSYRVVCKDGRVFRKDD
jgi:hypothetical protein